MGHRRIIIHPREIQRPIDALKSGFGDGATTGVIGTLLCIPLFALLLAFFIPYTLGFALLVVTCVIVPVVYYKKKISNLWPIATTLCYGAGFGLGLGIVPVGLTTLMLAMVPETRSAILLNLFLIPVLFGCITTLVCAVFGKIILPWIRTVQVNDGTLCENCGYSLVGLVTHRCPECGSKFAGTAINAAIDLVSNSY